MEKNDGRAEALDGCLGPVQRLHGASDSRAPPPPPPSLTPHPAGQVYNDADPWTAPGAAFQSMPEGRGLTYDLGGGGASHCVYPALGAQESIREWARVPETQKT